MFLQIVKNNYFTYLLLFESLTSIGNAARYFEPISNTPLSLIYLLERNYERNYFFIYTILERK